MENVDDIWIAGIGGIEIDHSWLHGTLMSTFSQPNGIGQTNYEYIWTDQTAPDGRGGRPL